MKGMLLEIFSWMMIPQGDGMNHRRDTPASGHGWVGYGGGESLQGVLCRPNPLFL